MTIDIPEFCLIALVGANAALRETFATRHFAPDEVVGRGASDESSEAFADVLIAAGRRLSARLLTVVDLGNRSKQERAALVHLAKQQYARPVAIVIEPSLSKPMPRPRLASATGAAAAPIRELHRPNLPRLDRDGFRAVYIVDTWEGIESATIQRSPIATDARHLEGGFDIIGDVHGCADELTALLTRLGYRLARGRRDDEPIIDVAPPENRRAVFLGDLTDRGPNSPDVLRIVMSLVGSGNGLCVLGNHDAKLLRWLDGHSVRPTHGLDRTIAQMSSESARFHGAARELISRLEPHYWLDGGRLAVVHAGIRENMLGRLSGELHEYCLYGETTGEIDSFGYPIRADWTAEYRGDATVVYGHTPMRRVRRTGKTICIDTGCVFGGTLTALRWPQMEFVSVPAIKVHFAPKAPIEPKRRRSPRHVRSDT